MALIVDSLVVELGLDASKFTLQQREALEAARRLEQQQEKAAKNIEHSAGKAGDAISGVRTQALELLGVLTGGAGLVAFGVNMTHANAQLGRLERNLGISGAEISKWQGLARIMGGDAQSMAASFTTVSDAFAGWKIGITSPLIADLRAISTAGGKIIDVNKGVEQSFLDLGENLKRIHDRDPAQAGLLGRRVGLDPTLFDAMITGNMEKVLELVKQIGVAGRADTDVFGELEKRMGLMGLKAEQIGRQVLGGESGGASVIIRLADWLNKKPGEAGSEFLDWISNGQAKAGSGQAAAPTARYGSLIPGGIGAFSSNVEKEQFIRSEAAKRGINPNIAMQVARSEGFSDYIGDNGTSFGAFQMHITPGGRGRAVGDQFREKTGLDPSDKRNERAMIAFDLDNAKKNGWSDYHGARRVGLDNWAGIDRGGGGSSSTATTEINVNGPINITPPAGAQPDAWANSFVSAVNRQSHVAQANSGAQ